jgi:glycosyltransferase involved in cell wall biosynthesis
MLRLGILAMAQQRHGGTLLYTLSMVEALRRLQYKNYELTLYTSIDSHEYDCIELPIVRLANPWRMIASRLAGKDPFHAVDKIIAPIYSGFLLFTHRPFAFTLHDLQERHYPEYFSMTTRLWRALINRILTARAARVICESDFVKHDIMQFCKTPEERIAMVPAPPIIQLSGKDLNEVSSTRVQHKFCLPNNFVFYPAQFWPHKNHLRLVEAFSLLHKTHPHCHLVLTGLPRDDYARVFGRIAEFGLGNYVHHVGQVEPSELVALYRCSTLVVIPTLFESISLPVFEAFSLGVPVCASKVVALPEQIGDAGLLFDPFSPEDIADKMRTLLDDEELRHRLVERGYRRMAAMGSDDYASRLADIVDAL